MGFGTRNRLMDMKFESGTLVASCSTFEYYTLPDTPENEPWRGPQHRLLKSSNALSWQQIARDKLGTYQDIALNEILNQQLFVVHLPLVDPRYVAPFNPDYLEEVVSLSTPVDVTASGTRIWQCIDIDNFSGANEYILAGTTSGLYRSNDGGATFTPL